MISRFRLWTLYALLIFLPLSAWLVSFSGNYLIALGRDILLALFVFFTALEWRKIERPAFFVWMGLIFVLAVLGSFFYREADLSQWLRGVRYLAEPVLLATLLVLVPLSASTRALALTLTFAVTLVVVLGYIEYFEPNWLRFTLDSTERGYLGAIHHAASLTRMQSTLAGPNALGLFLMVVLLLFPAWYRSLPKPLTILIGLAAAVAFLLTFSRSSYLGLFVGAVVLLIMARGFVRQRIGWFIGAFTVGVLILVGLFLWKPQELTRYDSNTLRFEQYEHVWRERGEIGFWGRGAGSAGLVSQFRFDDGPSRFTENTYLDIYESVGVIGALSYLTFFAALIVAAFSRRTVLSTGVAAALIALLVAGMFINHFTGQAALWTAFIAAGLALANPARLTERFIKRN